MGRTRLRGIEIAGVRLAIEEPSTLRWRWPERELAELECSPLDAEIHVGVRVGVVSRPVGETIFYESSGARFEIGAEAGGWVIAGYARDGSCERVARFDGNFDLGEVVVTPAWAEQGRCPLAHPFDELVLLHHAIQGGAAVLRGSVGVTGGHASVFLSEQRSAAEPAGSRNPLPADQHLVLRGACGRIADSDRIRVYTTPWAPKSCVSRLISAPLAGIHVMQASADRPIEVIEPGEAVGEILQYAFAPVYDPSIADGLFKVIESIVRKTPVSRLRRPQLDGVVSFTWQHSEASYGFTGLPV